MASAPYETQSPPSAGFLMPENPQQSYAPEIPEQKEKFGPAKTKLVKMIDSENLAEGMSEDELKKIGARVVDDWMIDEESRKDWLSRNKDAIELANQVKKDKTFPWAGAANVKLPIIADAAIKFAARAYGEIVKDDQVVKGKVIGPDPQGLKAAQAERVGKFMSWQLTQSMCEWEDDTDRLLHILPVVGHLFRKVYYDPKLKRNKSELVLPDKFCVNATASNLESARRGTHILENTHKNTVISMQRAGVWLDVDLDKLSTESDTKEPDQEKYYTFLEQHKWLDLDDDGFEEPYIVTVEKESRQVLRITARFEEDGIRENLKGQIQDIEPCQYFADYKFIPSFDGGYYHVGFGALLAPLNETANSLFNMLLDAGVMSNTGGGWLSKEIKVASGIYRFQPNEWKKTMATAAQLKNGVMPLTVREPSPTLFQLLGMVMDLCKDLASVKDVLAGDAPGANTPATTTMALISEAKQSLNAIYKRIYRSMKNEFGILFDLNYRYMDEEEYFKVLDEDAKVYRDDFDKESCDVIPMADPTMSSDMQRMAQSEALGTFLGQPGVESYPIQKRRLQALKLNKDEIDEILPEPDPNAPQPPNPELLDLQQKAEFKQAEAHLAEEKNQLDRERLDLDRNKAEYAALLQWAQTMKTKAEADAIPATIQNEALRTLVDSEHRGIEADMNHAIQQQQFQQQAEQSAQATEQPSAAPQ